MHIDHWKLASRLVVALGVFWFAGCAAPARMPVEAAPVAPAPTESISKPAPNDDGPYLNFDDDGIDARWICAGKIVTRHVPDARKPVALQPECGYPRPIELHPPTEIEAEAILPPVTRLVALSDTHGQFDLAVRLLQAHGVIDTNLDWSFGNGVLVLTGDVFDRGPRVTEIFWLLYGLEHQARKAGGAVHFLLGNHEYMVLRGDLRYVNEKYFETARRLAQSYPALYGGQTLIGQWLRSKRTILQIGDTLFMHGGLAPQFVTRGFDLKRINERYRTSIGWKKAELLEDPELDALHGSFSPIWYRGYFDGTLDEAAVTSLLESLGVRRIVVGHTSMDHVLSRFGGRVIAIDSSIKHGESGELLLFEQGRWERGLLDGRRLPLEDFP